MIFPRNDFTSFQSQTAGSILPESPCPERKQSERDSDRRRSIEIGGSRLLRNWLTDLCAVSPL